MPAFGTMSKGSDGLVQVNVSAYTRVRSVLDTAGGAVNSPIAAGTTKTIVVPQTAVALYVLNPVQSTGVVTIQTFATNSAFESGKEELGPGDSTTIPVWGLNDTGGEFPNAIQIVTAASTKASFGFDCYSATGARP